jgi:hypothetical protein
MSTYSNIPDVSFSVPFGKVNKIVWFDVQDISSTFDINFYIVPNQSKDINIEIFNYGSGSNLFKKTYLKSANSETITETVKLTHIPNKMTTIYGMKVS